MLISKIFVKFLNSPQLYIYICIILGILILILPFYNINGLDKYLFVNNDIDNCFGTCNGECNPLKNNNVTSCFFIKSLIIISLACLCILTLLMIFIPIFENKLKRLYNIKLISLILLSLLWVSVISAFISLLIFYFSNGVILNSNGTIKSINDEINTPGSTLILKNGFNLLVAYIVLLFFGCMLTTNGCIFFCCCM